LKLRILGSGGGEGIPSMFCNCPTCQKARALGGHDLRTRSCAIVNDRVMLDFSQDMFYNAYRFKLRLWELETIIFTHSHIDHLASAELCMKAPEYCNFPKPRLLTIYGNETCIDEIQRQLRFDLGQVPDVFAFNCLHAFQPVEIGMLRITPLPAKHAPGENAFLLLLENDNGCYLHCLDTSIPPKETIEFLRQRLLDAITMDCTYADSRDQSDSHMGLAANIRLKQQLLEQGSADRKTLWILSHIAHHSTLMHRELESLAAKNSFIVAYDGMEIQIG
jgi:phosphoribosyl 1,2-cyclic phosphate phosphodiesterase